MVDNKDKNGTPGDFDEDFDVEDFSESDFDEAAFDESEIADLPDGDFSDEDFADDEWQEDSSSKKLLTSGEKKGLSFNTMVIIGAVVLGGGVLAFNIMSKSAQQSASTEGGGGVFQSMLDISGVMDGDLFGKDTAKTPEELAVQAEQTQNEGFLNNPDNVIPSDSSTNPPQPTPIAPPDEAVSDNEPLTPMPEGATPRGPEEGTPESQVAIAETPINPAPFPGTESETPSAEDILKKAMASREQKAADSAPILPNEVAAEPEFTPEPESDVRPESVPVSTPSPVPAKEVAEGSPVFVPPPVVVKDSGELIKPDPVVSPPVVAPEVAAQNTEALEALDGRLEIVLKRMEQIETDLGSVKDSKQADTQNLEKTIQALKAEIAELKSRPVAAASPKKADKPVVQEQEEVYEEQIAEAHAVKKDAPKKIIKAKPVAKAQPSAAASRWELRAAQPGRAWLSKPGERDMQSVEVGQTISGIGRVTAILYQNGRWAVQGTQGQINQ